MSHASPHSITIAIVDANSSDYDGLLSVTESSNVSVCFLSKGSEAMRLVRRFLDIDLWIVNAALADMSGFDLAQLLRRHRHSKRSSSSTTSTTSRTSSRPVPGDHEVSLQASGYRPGFSAGRLPQLPGTGLRLGVGDTGERRPADASVGGQRVGGRESRRRRPALTTSPSFSPLFRSPAGARPLNEVETTAQAAAHGRPPAIA